MRIVHWGTFDLGKPRTRILRAGIASVGAEVLDCHTEIWAGLEDKTQAMGIGACLGILLRWLGCYPALIWRFLRGPKPDLVLTSFPGVLDTIILAPFARLRGVPLVWDLFISTYDTLAFDRALVRPSSLAGRLIAAIERLAIRSADLVVLDTEAHARRIESLFGLPTGSCGAVMVGVESEIFHPLPVRGLRNGRAFEVLFYGQFIPLHGIEIIIEAARLMSQDLVRWTLIGKGQEAGRIREMLEDRPLPKLTWIDWVAYDTLPLWIEKSDAVLGIFGTSEKAASVIPNKVFQAMACQRPIITRDSPAIRELLAENLPCCSLVPAGNASALVAAIRRHMTLAEVSGVPCHASLRETIRPPAAGRQFIRVVQARLPQAAS